MVAGTAASVVCDGLFSNCAAATMTTNDSPHSNTPSAIFIAVAGSRPRLPSHTQNHANSGASKTISTGFTDWNQLAGICQPPAPSAGAGTACVAAGSSVAGSFG